jgi:hypothetical protein
MAEMGYTQMMQLEFMMSVAGPKLPIGATRFSLIRLGPIASVIGSPIGSA